MYYGYRFMLQTQSSYHKTEAQLNAEQCEIEAAKANPKAFEVLYKKYHKDILLFVYQRVTDKPTAVDITQDVFVKALSKLNNYEYRGVPFSAWLFRIAINEVNQHHRKSKRAINVSTEGLASMAEEFDEDHTAEFELLTRSLAKLDKDAVELIEMRYFEKRPFQEIALFLETTEAAAKMKLYRILEKLKNLMNSDSHD